MKTISAVLFLSLAWIMPAHAGEFTRTSTFDSVAGFVASAKLFHPTSKTVMGRLFTIAEMGQPEDPKTGKPVAAERLDSCEIVWAGSTQALVFATATPKTEATPSSIGVLFLLSPSHEGWSISDIRRFKATGKYAEVTCALTAGAGTGYQFGEPGNPAVVAVTEHQGGRGYGYQVSASFSAVGTHLKQHDLE